MMEYKKAASRIGWGMAAFFLTAQVAQVLLIALAALIFPALVTRISATLLITDIGIYGIGLPVLMLICKGVPNADPQTPKQQKPVTPVLILKTLCMGFAAMYVANFIYLGIMTVFSNVSGYSLNQNVLEGVVGQSSLWEDILVFCVIPPILEELVFRKYLYKKIGAYGDNVFIFVSGLCFGLFHGNLNQFFYATLLGFLLAWLYVTTGNVVWGMLVHMIINIVGGIVAPAILGNDILLTLFGVFVLAVMITGIVCFIRGKRRGEFAVNPERKAEKGWVKNTLLNVGMMVYILLFIVLSILILAMPNL